MLKRSKMRAQRSVRGFTLIEMMIVVAIIGILASIAIPAFMKYIRRAKTTEAVMNLRKMFDSSVAYYESDHVGRGGAPIPHQFPGPVGPTPAVNPCCVEGKDKCVPAGHPDSQYPDAWDSPTWQALNFSVDDPHYFWYRYLSTGIRDDSRFTTRASGNLNCNFAFSTFERVGGINPNTGGVIGGAGIFSVNALE